MKQKILLLQNALDEKEILNILSKGENHTTEFKKSQTSITKDVYESVCAFSNRDGGHIFCQQSVS